MIVLILSIIFAFVVSFTCSLVEACILSISTSDIAEISKKSINVSKIWEDFKKNIQRPIAVILIINTLAHTIGATVAGSKFSELFGNRFIWLFSLIFSFAMILWTEILPKTLGVRYNRVLATFIAIPLKFLTELFNPLLVFFHFLNRPFEGKKRDYNPLEEITVLTQFAALNHQISVQQESLVAKSLELSKKEIKEIMVKKEDIKFLTETMSLTEAMIEAHIHHHTRYILVKDGDLNKISGYVNFKDIISALRLNPKNATLKGISRPLIGLNQNESVATVLDKMIKSYQHIAIVKDNSGKTTGIVTLENLLEALVGQIGDEYDIIPDYFYENDKSCYVAGGGVLISELGKKFNIEIEEPNLTINEWILKKFKNLMKPEAKIEYKSIIINIIKIRRSKVYEVLIEKKQS